MATAVLHRQTRLRSLIKHGDRVVVAVVVCVEVAVNVFVELAVVVVVVVSVVA